jgi:hypothetical protein
MLYNPGMASWIVHLRIAEFLLERIPGLQAEPFALGSVAPDSGMPDAKWETFTPPTQLTHFQDPSSLQRACADLEFYRRHLLPLRPDPEPRRFSFRLGYFLHLVTDNLWSERIGRPTRERWSAEFEADPDFIWEVKKDWYGLDKLYVRDHPASLFWTVFVQASPYDGGLDFLVPESLAWSVAHIQQYYQEQGAEVEALFARPFIYLSQAQMDDFVVEASRRLERIYEYLWLDGGSADSHATSLSLAVPQGG